MSRLLFSRSLRSLSITKPYGTAKPYDSKTVNNVQEYMNANDLSRYHHYYYGHIHKEEFDSCVTQEKSEVSAYADHGLNFYSDLGVDRVYITKRAANAMQNATNDNAQWKIFYPTFDKSSYTSIVNGWDNVTPGTLQDLEAFDTKQHAIAFCVRNGIKFIVLEDNERTFKLNRNYASNFRYRGSNERKPF